MTEVTRFEDQGFWVDVAMDKCTGVAACVDVCPVECYKLLDGKVDATNIGECIECFACDGICPEDALVAHSVW